MEATLELNRKSTELYELQTKKNEIDKRINEIEQFLKGMKSQEIGVQTLGGGRRTIEYIPGISRNRDIYAVIRRKFNLDDKTVIEIRNLMKSMPEDDTLFDSKYEDIRLIIKPVSRSSSPPKSTTVIQPEKKLFVIYQGKNLYVPFTGTTNKDVYIGAKKYFNTDNISLSYGGSFPPIPENNDTFQPIFGPIFVQVTSVFPTTPSAFPRSSSPPKFGQPSAFPRSSSPPKFGQSSAFPRSSSPPKFGQPSAFPRSSSPPKFGQSSGSWEASIRTPTSSSGFPRSSSPPKFGQPPRFPGGWEAPIRTPTAPFSGFLSSTSSPKYGQAP